MTDAKNTCRTALPLLALAALWSVPSHADQVLLETSPLVQGFLASATPFTVSAPGTVTVTLTDLDWTQKLASLTFAVTTPGSVLDSMSAAGQSSFTVSTAGVYSAVVGALAAPASPGSLAIGWYSLNISFAPAVPLPASSWLLLSGVIGLIALRFTKSAALGCC